jgi:hypothetical protein
MFNSALAFAKAGNRRMHDQGAHEEKAESNPIGNSGCEDTRHGQKPQLPALRQPAREDAGMSSILAVTRNPAGGNSASSAYCSKA